METGVVTFTVTDLRARLLHGAGQGRGLQAHPGLLPEQCRRGRRAGRHDRRPRRLRAADRLRRAQSTSPASGPAASCCCSCSSPAPSSGCISPSSAWNAARRRRRCRSCPNSRKWRRSTSPSMSAPCPARCWREWKPEDTDVLGEQGPRHRPAQSWISIPALLLAFAIWMVWSVVVAKLPAVGFKFTTDQLFWLAAMPGLSGATLRIFYSFMVPIFGGRLWTTLATWSLMIPAVGIGYAVQTPSTPYFVFLALALLCGLGGGNFASSMANISFFFPKRREGQRARAQRRPRQSRRQRRAVRGADRDHRRRVRLVRRRSGDGGERNAGRRRSGCRTPASSGCRSSRSALSPPGSA